MLVGSIAAMIIHLFEAEPWKRIESGGVLVFGVEMKKRVAYAVLGGKENGGFLVLCRNAQALAAYSALMDAKNRSTDEMELINLQLDQDFLEVRKEAPDETALNNWLELFGVEQEHWLKGMPILRRHKPGRLPTIIEEEDEPELILAMNAAISLTESKHFEEMMANRERAGEHCILSVRQEGENELIWHIAEQNAMASAEYPSLSLQDELAARRLRRLPVNGSEVTCAVRMLPIPMDETADRVAVVMLLHDDQRGNVAAPVVGDYETQYAELAEEYIRYVEECGRPRSIVAADPRAYCLLRELAQQMSTPIRRADRSDVINDSMRSMMNFMKEGMQKEHKASGKAPKATGRGICLYCEKEYAASGMTKHIKACGEKNRETGEAEYFMIRVTDEDDPNFWLYVDIKRDASLRQLDQFLRDVWVECCGHMSAFEIDGEEYLSDASEGGYGMNARLNRLLKNGSRFSYEYDFGTPTNLRLQVVDEYKARDRRKKAVIAARNIMPKYHCVRCGKRAELVLRMGMKAIEASVFCEECAKKEEYADSMLPLLNSPRTGLCGYGAWFGCDE